MSNTTSSIASVLNDLVEACKDGQYGFHTAADTVKDSNLKELFNEYSFQRQQYATELQSAISGLGEEVEKSGSLSGTLHRGWIDIKAALSSGDEHAILAECERGEDAAVAAYRDALQNQNLPEQVRTLVNQQYSGVQAAHDRVRDLRDSFQNS